jgi:hypothetical protein
MMDEIRLMGLSLVVATATLGCAQMGDLLADLDTTPQLKAWGPGTVFPSIETAAVDALIHTYLQASNEKDTERMRAGTIYRVDTGYSYGEIHTASNMLTDQFTYPLKRQDVARFHMYPRFTFKNQRASRSELVSRADRRSVNFTDPLHRPLFILHPSLKIREYRGGKYETVEVADLRHWTPETLLALHSH